MSHMLIFGNVGHNWFVVFKMVDCGMPLAHALFLPITYCAYSVIGVSVIRLIALGYFTFFCLRYNIIGFYVSSLSLRLGYRLGYKSCLKTN